MKLTSKIEKALSEQINAELYSAYLYMAMASEFSTQNLPGFMHWLLKQVEEELKHAHKFMEYALDRDAILSFPIINATVSYRNMEPVNIWKEVLKHEEEVTSRLFRFSELVVSERDYPTGILLQWFISEQVEEENSVKLILRDLERVTSFDALLILDRELAKR